MFWIRWRALRLWVLCCQVPPLSWHYHHANLRTVHWGMHTFHLLTRTIFVFFHILLNLLGVATLYFDSYLHVVLNVHIFSTTQCVVLFECRAKLNVKHVSKSIQFQVEGKFRILYAMRPHANLYQCLNKVHPGWLTKREFEDFFDHLLTVVSSPSSSKFYFWRPCKINVC